MLQITDIYPLIRHNSCLRFSTIHHLCQVAIKLNLPAYEPEVKKIEDQLHIRCLVRKKWLLLTPEEWVRQHILHYLKSEQRIPLSRMALEYPITYNGKRLRADVLVFSDNGQPHLLVECKAPYIKLEDKVLLQIAVYNADLKVPNMLITNGMEHHWFRHNGKQFEKLKKDEHGGVD